MAAVEAWQRTYAALSAPPESRRLPELADVQAMFAGGMQELAICSITEQMAHRTRSEYCPGFWAFFDDVQQGGRQHAGGQGRGGGDDAGVAQQVPPAVLYASRCFADIARHVEVVGQCMAGAEAAALLVEARRQFNAAMFHGCMARFQARCAL